MAGLLVGGLGMVVAATPAHAALPVCNATTGDITACCKITGSNPTAPVGIGIHVLATAPGALVNGGADLNPSASTIGSIASFATGIQNDAAKATFGFFFVASSGGNAIVNNGVNASFFDFWSISNEANLNGLVDTASGALFFNFYDVGNGGNGVVLKSPPAPAPPTTNVRIMDFTTGSPGSSNSNSGYGVVLKNVVANDLESFLAYNNKKGGVLISGGSGNKVSNFNAGMAGVTGSSNTGYGVTVASSSGNFINDFYASTNSQGGVHVVLSNGNRIGYFSAFQNTGPGVWLDSASQNTVGDADICGNTTSGVYIGCSSGTLPSGTSCGAAPPSNGNTVTDTAPGSNDIGIGVDKGNKNNRIIANDAIDPISNTPCVGGNSSDDLVDGNGNCSLNLWLFNNFTNGSPSNCID
jgi:hypothetical protein